MRGIFCFLVILFLLLGCGDETTTENQKGSLSNSCYSDGSCDSGLICNENNICEELINDLCEGVNCSNYGDCEVQNGDAICICDDGYHSEGLNCVEDEVDLCEGVNCSNYGDCEVQNGEAICVCDDGYHSEGLNCVEDEVDLCEGVNCSNYGDCEVQNGDAICICDDGYHADGLNCIEDEVFNCDEDDMCLIPEGSFMMGCNDSIYDNCRSNEYLHEVYLDNYKMDKYEVTVSQFQACVDAGVCEQENYGTTLVNELCNYGSDGKSNHPMNCINWYGAEQYCEWVGKRLPTEAEWEKGAKGTDQRVYPWGNSEPTCDHAVMNDQEAGCYSTTSLEVGSKPLGISPYGLYDMSGNVREWVSDWYDSNYYYNSPLNNPQGPDSTPYQLKVLRGSSWQAEGGEFLRNSRRSYDDLHFSTERDGFRCVKSVE